MPSTPSVIGSAGAILAMNNARAKTRKQEQQPEPPAWFIILIIILFLLSFRLLAQNDPQGQVVPRGPTPPATCTVGEIYFDTDATIGLNWLGCTNPNTWTLLGDGGGGGVPSGMLTFIVTGTCPAGWTEETSLNGKMLFGTLAAGADVGTTGGNDNITPAGTVSQPTFTGNSVASDSVSGGTPSGTIAWPVGVPTFAGNALGTHLHGVGTFATSAHAGTAVGDHASHTHTYTDVVNHVHLETAPTGQTGGQDSFTRDTSTNGSSNTALSTANPTGGVATGTTAGPSATLTHSVTQPSTHTLSGSSEAVSAGTPAGTNSWPAGVPTFAGNVLPGHLHLTTATGTVSQPTFSGTQFDNRSAFVKVIFCKKD